MFILYLFIFILDAKNLKKYTEEFREEILKIRNNFPELFKLYDIDYDKFGG